jgi:two-component system, cell cycle sensor histidine kinase and response regulator CckA
MSLELHASARRSILFQLRGVLWIVIACILVFRSASVSPSLWTVGTIFLLSAPMLLLLPLTWFDRPGVGYAVFFLDLAGLTILLRSTVGIDSGPLLLFYLTVFMATVGESLSKSLGVAVVVTALYVWLYLGKSGGLITSTEALLRIPLFFATAASCGYLAQEVRVQKLKAQKRAHEEIQESEKRYRTLFKSNPQPMWVQDRATLTFLAVNDAAVQHYGYSVEEFQAMTIKDICVEEEVSPPSEGAPKTKTRFNQGTERKHRKKDGNTIYVQITSNCIEFAARSAELVLASDITDRKEAEEALRTANQTLKTLIQASPLAIISCDRDTLIKSWNPAAERIFGWNELEVLEQPLPMVPGDHQSGSHDLVARVLTGEVLADIEMRLQRKDGTPIDVSLSAAPLYDAQRHIYGIAALAADVSERHQLEEHLRQSQKMEAIGRLAGGIAHDFNNLLTIITGYSQMLLERLDPKSLEHEDVEEILKAGNRASSLTRQLLVFSRKQVLAPQVLDLNVVVTNIDKMLRRLIGEDIELVLELEANLAPVKADPGQMEQVILNLAVNARDAMPQGGKFIIETATVIIDESYSHIHPEVARGCYAMLKVTDTGVGMDAETQKHIFEPFFTTKEKGKGTGLGLATVFGVVKQTGGYISVSSEVGKGATFTIYLPGLEKWDSPNTESEETHPSATREKESVLLVEDEDGVRLLASKILQERGYTVFSADTPERAIHICENHPGNIALLLTDLVMPGMSGRQLAECLLPRHPEMKVLYMSGYTDDAVLHHGVSDLRAPFLQKPFSADALARKVREVLDAV